MSPKAGEPLYEPCAASSVFVDELCAITNLGAVTHLVFSARQVSVSDDRTERVVQARLIVPTDRLQTIARALLAGQVHVAPVDRFGEPVELH